MKRTTITLSDELASLVAREARRRRTSVSDVVRTSLARDLRGEGRRDIPWAGLCEDDTLPPASEIDKALDAGWSDELDRGRR